MYELKYLQASSVDAYNTGLSVYNIPQNSNSALGICIFSVLGDGLVPEPRDNSRERRTVPRRLQSANSLVGKCTMNVGFSS